jgi:hypothetical protein
MEKRFMRFPRISDPNQPFFLKTVLDSHCDEFGIASGSPTRKDIAARISIFFLAGIHGPGELEDALRVDRAM